MRVGMLFPFRDKCGVAIFSREVVAALEGEGVAVVAIDSDAPAGDVQSEIRACDLLHVQYETGLFMRERTDRFTISMKNVPVPVLVSLHEVYRESPFAFPRSTLSGGGLAGMVKRLWWDFRHPVQRAETIHCRNRYYADRLLVFYPYQKDILRSRGVSSGRVHVIGKPMFLASTVPQFMLPALPALHIGVCGFVNPSYDVDLLFAALEKLERPWICTWAGGVPTSAAEGIAASMREKISANKWENRFFLTGWLSHQAYDTCIQKMDIVLALFKNRSTSDTIIRSMGWRKPVIATRLPLTMDIATYDGTLLPYDNRNSPILLCDGTAQGVADEINRVAADTALRKNLFSSLCAYNATHTYRGYAAQLISLYQTMGTV